VVRHGDEKNLVPTETRTPTPRSSIPQSVGEGVTRLRIGFEDNQLESGVVKQEDFFVQLQASEPDKGGR
jgi:hypothetical protein